MDQQQPENLPEQQAQPEKSPDQKQIRSSTALIFLVIIVMIILAVYWWMQSTEETTNTTEQNVNGQVSEPPNDKYEDNPQYCEQDNDCIAVDNPNNPCYKAYFNIYAAEEIEAYKNQTGMMKQDCPYNGLAVCVDNQCISQKQEI